MLVLSRKEGQTIKIGDDITLRFQKLGRSRVSVAIDAPGDVSILRGELLIDGEDWKDLLEQLPTSDAAIPAVA